MSRSLRVELGARSYPIVIGPRLIERQDSYTSIAGRPALLLTDENVAEIHLPVVRQTLGLAAERCLVVPAGESSKSMESLSTVLDWMLAMRLPRDGVLIALGGGVIGDLAGFAAAVYQRGIDFLQVPTTLLAQVDSSVGGKTGINHSLGKNMIGAFHQPTAVIADSDVMRTLPPREWRAGLAEVIKYALLGDSDFLDWLEAHQADLLQQNALVVQQAVEHCCAMKARIVAADEREAGQRALLNLGHTFGHAIEAEMGYGEWLHGEAVAAGMVLAAQTSERLGWISAEDTQRVVRMIEGFELPTTPPRQMTPEHFRTHMALDKEVAAGKLRLVLLRALGDAVLTAETPPALLDEVLSQACSGVAA